MRYLVNIVLVIGLLAAVGCDKNSETSDIQPVAAFRVVPELGNTTTMFRFNADSSIGQGTRNNPVMVRWDWESDGIWDRMYSTGGEITHRFFKPGDYRIFMEASTLTGKRDTMIFNISISQGYSAPRARFVMTPDSANIFTIFSFDATRSKDDEDSLDQLQFRWDFDGDLNWDTDYSGNPQITHQFQDNQHYGVRLQVKDPQDMTSIQTDTLIVTRFNDRIVPVVTHECWPCTLEDTVRFDASASYLQDQPEAKLLYSWDIWNDNIWERALDSSPYFSQMIGSMGKIKVRVRVTDEQGLYMDFTDTVELFPLNSEPVTRLVIGNRIGNTGTNYYLHLRESTDRDNSILDLSARWDVNNDGVWDSQYDELFEINLTFPSPGKYPVTAMVTDPNNKFSIDTDTIWVTTGKHETGLLEDKRNVFIPMYYGTVKIGDRWWMQSNLQFIPPEKGSDWANDYYNNDSRYKDRYGALYPQIAVVSQKPAACPKEWHVPTLAEWQQLMVDLGQDASMEAILEGGRSDLHIILAGQKDYDYGSANKKDKFSGLGEMANFWTSNVTPTGQANAWYIDPIRKQNRPVVVGKNYWFPIRCIKD